MSDLIFQLFQDPLTWGRGVAMRWIALFLFMGFLALLVLGVALLWRRGADDAAATTEGDDALDALRLRYARGEITREEFLEVHEDLSGRSPPSESP